jgi:GNAT superfamily N-acetyltransferase
MGALRVEPVAGRRDLREFVALPYRLHRQDPCWVAPLRRDVRAQLDRRRNPFFEHGEAAYFLARRDGAPVGRVAAIHNRLHNETQHERVGFFGFFECADDPEAAAALFAAAERWLAARGLERLRGPASFTINDECGLLVDGFDTPPALLMPHNPPRYVALLEGAGFAKAKDLVAYRSTSTELPPRLVRGAELAARRYGLSVRALELERFADEIAELKRIFNGAWSGNWGFVPMTEREIDQLARQLKPIVVPELVVFAEHAGRAVACGVALPDLNVALRANPSGRLVPGILKVLWAARRITRLRVLILGALPEWRGRGLDALLYKEIWERGRARGYSWAEAGWVLEDNHPMRNGLERMGFEVYKTYRMYERPIGAGA